MLNRYCSVLLLVGAMLTMALSAEAQGSKRNRGKSAPLITIEGEVKGEGSALEQATVYLGGTHINTNTDQRGRFTLKARPGRYTLVVRHVGYRPHRQPVELREGQALGTIRVNLRFDKTHQLREVVTTGRRRQGEAYDRGFPMQIVETQRMATQSVQTSELLERVSGVKVRQDGGLGSHTHYNINGFSGNSVRIFIDGNPAENFGQSFSINSLPPALIERIEVFKGVLPGYLSSDALGGAINIVLKEQRRNALQTSYSYGSFNTHQWNATGSMRSRKGLFAEGTAFYNYSDNNYKVRPAQGLYVEGKDSDGKFFPLPYAHRFHDAYRSYGSRVALGIERQPWADKLSLSATLSSTYKEIQHGATMATVYGNRHSRGSSAILGLDYSKRDLLISGLDVTLHGSYSWLNRQVIDTVGTQYSWAGIVYDRNNQPITNNSGAESGSQPTLAKDMDETLLVKARVGYRINEHSQVFANVLHNSFSRDRKDPLENALLVQLRDVRDLDKTVGSLTYERRDFGGRLTSSLFAKYYSTRAIAHVHRLRSGQVERVTSDRRMNDTGYGLTLAYQLTPTLQLQLSGERALRMPEPRELFGDLSNNLSPSSELEPEKSLNLNLGAVYRLSWGGLHHLSASALLLYRDTRGMIRETFAMATGREEFSSFSNLDHVLSYGADIELSYSYDYRLEARLSLSKLRALSNTKYGGMGEPHPHYRKPIPNEPTFKLNGQISYTQPNLFMRGGRGSVYVGANFVESFDRYWSGIASRNLAIIPEQFVLDAGLSYSLPKHRVTLSLDAKNLLDKQVFDSYGLPKPGFALFGKVTFRIL